MSETSVAIGINALLFALIALSRKNEVLLALISAAIGLALYNLQRLDEAGLVSGNVLVNFVSIPYLILILVSTGLTCKLVLERLSTATRLRAQAANKRHSKSE